MQLILILKISVSTRSIKKYMYKYKNKDKIIYSSYTGTLQTSYHLDEHEIVLRWSRIWHKLVTGSTSGQLYTEGVVHDKAVIWGLHNIFSLYLVNCN